MAPWAMQLKRTKADGNWRHVSVSSFFINMANQNTDIVFTWTPIHLIQAIKQFKADVFAQISINLMYMLIDSTDQSCLLNILIPITPMSSMVRYTSTYVSKIRFCIANRRRQRGERCTDRRPCMLGAASWQSLGIIGWWTWWVVVIVIKHRCNSFFDDLLHVPLSDSLFSFVYRWDLINWLIKSWKTWRSCCQFKFMYRWRRRRTDFLWRNVIRLRWDRDLLVWRKSTMRWLRMDQWQLNLIICHDERPLNWNSSR